MSRHCQCASCIRERREFRRFMWRCLGVVMTTAAVVVLLCLLV